MVKKTGTNCLVPVYAVCYFSILTINPDHSCQRNSLSSPASTSLLMRSVWHVSPSMNAQWWNGPKWPHPGRSGSSNWVPTLEAIALGFGGITVVCDGFPWSKSHQKEWQSWTGGARLNMMLSVEGCDGALERIFGPLPSSSNHTQSHT